MAQPKKITEQNHIHSEKSSQPQQISDLGKIHILRWKFTSNSPCQGKERKKKWQKTNLFGFLLKMIVNISIKAYNWKVPRISMRIKEEPFLRTHIFTDKGDSKSLFLAPDFQSQWMTVPKVVSFCICIYIPFYLPLLLACKGKVGM